LIISKKTSCSGCFALFEDCRCELGYDLEQSKYSTSDDGINCYPLEECPKPMTKKELKMAKKTKGRITINLNTKWIVQGIEQIADKLQNKFIRAISLITTFITAILFGVFNVFFGTNTQIANILLSAFIVSMAIYLIPLRNNIETYFTNNKIDSIVKEISELKEVNDLFDTYTKISVSGFTSYKEKILKDTLAEFQRLRFQKKTGELTIRTGQEWSVPLLKSLHKDDYVKAVTFLNDERGEWNNDSALLWNAYMEANEIAARKCKFVIRIFITDEAKLKKYLSEKDDNIVKRHHIIGELEENKMNGIFVEKRKLEHLHPALLDAVEDSFILINSNKVGMAVIDKFKDKDKFESRYKVQISYNEHEIKKMEDAFDEICKVASKELSFDFITPKTKAETSNPTSEEVSFEWCSHLCDKY
jgi:hypothetical protein